MNPSIAEDTAVAHKDLVRALADQLSGRVFSPRVKLLDIKQVCEATGLCRRTIYRMMDAGKFPKPQRGLGKKLLWRESTLIAWLDRNDPNHPSRN